MHTEMITDQGIGEGSSAVRTPKSSWAMMSRPPSCGYGKKNAARSSPRTCPVTLSSSSGSLPRNSIGGGMRRIAGDVITDVQRLVRHPTVRWMGATLDGRVEASAAVFEAKFMLPWSFSEEAAAEKHMPQLQHNMWVVAARVGGPLRDHRRRQVGGNQDPCRSAVSAPHRHRRAEILAAASRVASPLASLGSSRQGRVSRRCPIVDMSASNAWPEFARDIFIRTGEAHLEHEKAKAELKSLMKMPGKRPAMGFAPDAQNPAP